MATRQAADRGRAEAQQHRRAVGGVALEVAAQAALPCRLRERVPGQGEVVQAQRLVAHPPQHRLGTFRLPQPRDHAGQQRGVDRLLVRPHPGHMRVAEDRDPVGAEPGGEAGAGLHMRDGLPRQPVHQVQVDAADPRGAQPLHRARDRFRRLRPPDPGLDLRRDVLNAQACPVEAHPGQGAGQRFVQQARVELDRQLRIVTDMESLPQRRQQGAQPLRAQDRGGAAPQMQVRHAGMWRQRLRQQRDLGQKRLGIGADARCRTGRLRVAGAVPAELPAEGHVHVERQRVARPHALAEPVAVAGFLQRPELRGGGIAGVAGHPCLREREQRAVLGMILGQVLGHVDEAVHGAPHAPGHAGAP